MEKENIVQDVYNSGGERVSMNIYPLPIIPYA